MTPWMQIKAIQKYIKIFFGGGVGRIPEEDDKKDAEETNNNFTSLGLHNI